MSGPQPPKIIRFLRESKPKIDNLEESFQTVETTVSDITDTVSTIQNNIGQITSDVNELKEPKPVKIQVLEEDPETPVVGEMWIVSGAQA